MRSNSLTGTRAQRVLIALLLLGLGAGSAAAQQGNVEDGADIFKKKCGACHEVGPAAQKKVGPILNDIINRHAGAVAGYNYSPANKEAGAKGLVWSEDTLFKYLADPRAFLPGTIMAFAGLKDEQDRRDIIAYLKKFSNK